MLFFQSQAFATPTHFLILHLVMLFLATCFVRSGISHCPKKEKKVSRGEDGEHEMCNKFARWIYVLLARVRIGEKEERKEVLGGSESEQ